MGLRGVINGSEYLLMVDRKYVIFGTNLTFAASQNTKDITCRETDNWNKSLLKNREWSMEFEGKLGFTYPGGSLNPTPPGTNYPNGFIATNLEEIITKCFTKQKPVSLTALTYYSTAASIPPNTLPITPYWMGKAYLTGVAIGTPNEASGNVTMSFSGSGELMQISL